MLPGRGLALARSACGAPRAPPGGFRGIQVLACLSNEHLNLTFTPVLRELWHFLSSGAGFTKKFQIPRFSVAIFQCHFPGAIFPVRFCVSVRLPCAGGFFQGHSDTYCTIQGVRVRISHLASSKCADRTLACSKCADTTEGGPPKTEVFPVLAPSARSWRRGHGVASRCSLERGLGAGNPGFLGSQLQ